MKITTFGELNLPDFITDAITDLKYETPSSIQAEGIPHIMAGTDVIATAPTGSGKTAAYAIPILQKIISNDNTIQALILCPTRELTIQVHKEFEKLTKYKEEITAVSIYGGQNIERQFNALDKNPQIIIATPGRLMDHLERGSINLENVTMAVLDEADEMLDMGFRDDIYNILEKTPDERQTILFSATMAKDIIELTKKIQKTPMIVDVTNNLLNTPDIEQLYFETTEKEKIELISRLLDLYRINSALIFCNTKTNVDKTVEALKTRGFLTDSLHGDMNQSQREKVMRGFHNGSVKILIATDVAGRGIDVKDIDAVFNYDLPRDDEDYIHRIGRTGRAGESGRAFTFVTKRQVSVLKRIERANGVKINQGERPSVEELEVARFQKYLEEIQRTIAEEDLSEYKEKIEKMTGETVTTLDIAAAFYKLSTKKEQQKINRKLVFEEVVDEEKPSKQRRSGDYSGKKRYERKDRKYDDKPKRSYTRKSDDSEKRSYEGKYGTRNEEKKSYDDKPKRSYARKSDDGEKRSYEGKFGTRNEEKKSYEDKPKRSYTRKSDDGEKRPYSRKDGFPKKLDSKGQPYKKYSKSEDEKPFRKAYGDTEKRSYGKKSSDNEKKPFKRRTDDSEKRSYTRKSDSSEKRPYSRKNDDKKPYGRRLNSTDGERKPFKKRTENDEKPTYNKKSNDKPKRTFIKKKDE